MGGWLWWFCNRHAARRREGRFFFQAEDGIRDHCVTGVQTCALPILHSRNVSILGLHVSPLAKLAGKRWVIHEPLHLLCQGRRVTVSKQQTILLMMDIFSHPPAISGNDGDAGLESLVDHQWRILHPDGWHDHRITAIKYFLDNVRVVVFAHPLDAFTRISR